MEERKKVKFLATDMNAAYFQLTKKVFPTADIPIDRLLSFSSNLKEAYDSFQLLTYHFGNKDADSFFELLKNLPNSLDRLFKDKLENLLAYATGIRNALLYDFFNGKIDAKNTHIKTLKRVSYGFKSFSNMRIRIFLINGLIKIK